MDRPGVRSHNHRCACGKSWDCGMLLCSPAHHRVKTCIQCIKRAEEINSGEQEKINFEPVITYTYAHYSDFMTFTEMAVDSVYISKEVIEAVMKQLTTVGWTPPEDLVKQ
jgi:hypothetical protein